MTPESPLPDAEWLHALRNAVNAVAVSVALARRLVPADDAAGVDDALARAEDALARARTLLHRDAP